MGHGWKAYFCSSRCINDWKRAGKPAITCYKEKGVFAKLGDKIHQAQVDAKAKAQTAKIEAAKEAERQEMSVFTGYKSYGNYTGYWVNGKRHGKGEARWSNGFKYEGDWVDGELSKGKITYHTGNVYEGDFNGRDYYIYPHGKGKMTYTDGNVYEGGWKGDFNGSLSHYYQHGKGKMVYTNGDVYEGDWANGNRHGTGKYISPNYYIYNGKWVDDQKTGYGKINHSDGEAYEGDWLNDEYHGTGKLTTADGKVKEGRWEYGILSEAFPVALLNGVAVRLDDPINWNSNIKDGNYRGDLVNGVPHGTGKLTWGFNDFYRGDFVNGEMTGKGKRCHFDNIYEGDFVNGKFHGMGKLTYVNGKIEEGRWENGKLIGEEEAPSPQAGTTVFCTSCGTKLPADAKFCSKCGTKTQAG
jgi:hypothetical protein